MGVVSSQLTQLSILHPDCIHRSTEPVTAKDYESIIQTIYPNTESVSVVGGEELRSTRIWSIITITIKPKNGEFVSDFDKNTNTIKSKKLFINRYQSKNT